MSEWIKEKILAARERERKNKGKDQDQYEERIAGKTRNQCRVCSTVFYSDKQRNICSINCMNSRGD